MAGESQVIVSVLFLLQSAEPEPEPEPELQDRELTEAPPPSYQAAANFPSVLASVIPDEKPPPYPGKKTSNTESLLLQLIFQMLHPLIFLGLLQGLPHILPMWPLPLL